ncbi:hypothetical protein CC117_32995 [Parafrankia colletiae]|uniref:Uncharacterized protein n=1 Tax=Parafrankia colletiae TaxID=573497 RepID=A0A1S1RBP6_9ACTN|nr:hypothetical protein CC117_32995 [Parafrankia colletiae]
MAGRLMIALNSLRVSLTVIGSRLSSSVGWSRWSGAVMVRNAWASPTAPAAVSPRRRVRSHESPQTRDDHRWPFRVLASTHGHADSATHHQPTQIE